jgi:hypothetical protein
MDQLLPEEELDPYPVCMQIEYEIVHEIVSVQTTPKGTDKARFISKS